MFVYANIAMEVKKDLKKLKNGPQDYKCNLCDSVCSILSNLKRHVKKRHPQETDYLNTLNKRFSKTFAYTCEMCGRHYNSVHHYKYHLRRSHKDKAVEGAKVKTTRKCAMCEFDADKQSVLNHYREEHQVDISESTLQFATKDEFVTWKDNLEETTCSRFVTERSSKSSVNNTLSYYICHRSGKFVSKRKGEGLRKLKKQGSSKIGAYCPASIRCKRIEDDRCEVHFISTHIGHNLDLRHLTLTPMERQYVASKIATGMSFDEVLEDVRQKVGESERLHLLTRKDLHNIKNSYKIETEVAVDEDIDDCNLDNDNDGDNIDDSNLDNYNDGDNIDCNSDLSHCSDDKQIIITIEPDQPVVPPPVFNLAEEKERLKNMFMQVVDAATTEAELDAIRNCLNSIEYTYLTTAGETAKAKNNDEVLTATFTIEPTPTETVVKSDITENGCEFVAPTVKREKISNSLVRKREVVKILSRIELQDHIYFR